MTKLSRKFYIEVPSEYSAGIRGITDTITITCDSGEFPGDPGEFEEAMAKFLAEYYDTAGVSISDQSIG